MAYKGSTCNISARVNKNIRQAQVFFSSGDSLHLIIRDKKLSGKFTIKKQATYSFNLIDESNIPNQNPIEYSITLLDDYYPSITILEPEEDIESIPDASIALKMEANDDFGLSKMNLSYQIVDYDSGKDSIYTQINLPYKFNNQKVFSNSYIWDLSELPIGFDETLKYYITVWDNDVVSGPKSSKSRLHYIRFPSLDQLFEEFASVEEKNIEELEDMTDVNEELKKELEKIQREFKQDKKLDWERKKQIKSTIKKQNDLQQKLEQIEQEIDEAVKKLAEKNLFSPEVLEKYNQLQELFQEIASPELLEAMQELQKSIESVDKRKVEQALNQMTINQEKFKEKLERTLELFKKIQLEQELDRLVQTAERMTQKQNDITKDLNDPNKSNKDGLNDLEQSQKQQSENLEQLTESAQDLLDEEMLKEFQEAWEKLKEALEQTNQQQLSQQMQQMQQQLSKQNVNQAKSTSQSLEQQLKQSQAAMNKQNKEEILAKMQKTTNNLLQLSKDEEALMQETKELSNFSDDFRNKAQTQKEISDNLRKVIKDMIELSKETFFLSPKTNQIMGNAFGNMDKGLNALEERNKNNASQFQQDAMASLNPAPNGMSCM